MRSKLQIFWFGVFTLLLVCSSYAQLSMIRNPLTNAGAGDGGDLPLGSVVSMIDPMTVEGCATDGLPVGVVTTVESRTAAPDLYVVASSGIARVTIAGGSSAITPGDNVVPASTGFIQNISDNPTGFVVGIALESGTAGSTIRIMINVHTGGGGASMNNDTLVQLTSPGDFVVVAGEDDIHGALVDLDAAIGNRTYTENNYVTDGETVTSSLDALDQAMLLASTIEGDVVAGDGLNGGADDVLPGADADVTLTVDAGTGLEINGGTGALQVDQDDIPYTATTGTDWIDPDPTYVNTALDQAAERIALLESGSGTVTSITGGNGIDPDGPSEGDVTLNLDVATTGALSTTAGDGDQLAVNTDGFIAVNATNQLEIDGSSAGNGLIGGDGSALAVGDGAGLTINADDIEVNTADGVTIDGDNVVIDETWFGNDVTVSATGDVTINDDAVQDSDIDWGDGADQIDADNVPYDNTTSGMTATEVEGAIDEIDGRVDGLESATVSLQDAYDVSGDIVVDPSTPVTITSSGAGNRALDVTAGAETAILVVNDGADPAIQARNDGSGPAIYSNGDLRFTGAAGTKIYSNADINVMPDENDDATVNAFNVLEPTGGTAVFIADENGDITTVGDYHVGTIGYSDNGTDAATAGASLVGTFDEFDNSDAGNVQDVLDDLDGAISTASTVQGDIVSGDGLAGGVDDVLPGPDADVTLSINVANGVEIASDNVQIDEDAIPYTPTTLTDWTGDADPGMVNNALDDLAGRVDGLEAVEISLQDAYDVGNTISVTGDAIDIDATTSTAMTLDNAAATFPTLSITNTAPGTHNSDRALELQNDGDDPTLYVSNDGDGPAIQVTDDIMMNNGTRLASNVDVNVQVDQDNTGDNEFNVRNGTDATVFSVDENGDVVADGDYHVGTIGLSDNGTDAATAGASLVGTFDEFDNSDATNVQDVLDDLDGALSVAGTVQGDLVAGTGLTGGADDILPGADADYTINIDNTYFSNDATVDAAGAVTISDDAVQDSDIDWGTGADQVDADNIPYDNTTSGMAATEVEGAIDEMDGRIDGIASSLETGTTNGNTLRWNSTSGAWEENDVISNDETDVTVDATGVVSLNADTGMEMISSAHTMRAEGTAGTVDVTALDGHVWVSANGATNGNLRLYGQESVDLISSGTLDVDSDDDITIDADASATGTDHNLDINNADVYVDGTNDYHIGTVGLTDAGTDAATSGASLTGAFDEFDNSDATNVQDVLDDLDGAISTAGTVQGDLVAGTGLTGGADNVLPGADADYTVNLDNTYFSGDVSVASDGTVTIESSAAQGDLVAGTGLTGGADDIIVGSDTDYTVNLDNTYFSGDATVDASGVVTITDDAVQDSDIDWGAGADQIDADNVPYDNTTSGLTATEVEGAIDEIDGRLDGLSSSLETGTTNGNTLRWNSTSGAWEENDVISNDETDVTVDATGVVSLNADTGMEMISSSHTMRAEGTAGTVDVSALDGHVWVSANGATNGNLRLYGQESVDLISSGALDVNATGAATVTANSGLDIDVTGVATLDASTSVGIRGANGASFRSTSGPAIVQAEGGPANLRGNTNVTVEATTLQTHVAAGTNVNISAGTAGATGDITLNAPHGDVLVTNADVYVEGANDYHIGTVGLTDTGAGAGTSGAFLVGTYDEFDNSDATNVQDVLDDLDGAISSAGTVQGDLVAGTGLTGGADNILPGADADYTVNIDNTYFSNDATVDAAGAVTISDDAVQDSDIDWGTGADQIDADNVPYDNTTSGMTATEVEGAIDEIDGRIDGLETGTGATLDNGNGIVAFSYDGSTDASVEVAGGTGITVDGTGVNVDYGSTTGTAVEGNTSVSIVAGTGMSGGGAVTLGSGGTVTLNNDGVTSVNGSSGDVTLANLTQGTGINAFTYNGSAATTVGLSNTGVTAATYGDATHVSQVTVDAQGRITSASDVEITGASPTGAALTSGNIWVGNASNTAEAVAMSGDATLAAGGGLTLANSGVTAGTYGDATNVAQVTVDAKGRVTSATEVAIDPDDADADPVNEAQTLAGSGTTDITLSDVSGSGGGTVTFAGTGATSVSRTGNTITINSSDDSGSDDQTLTYNAATDEITIEDGNTIDISEVNTDNQNISGSSFDAGTANLTIGIEDGTSEVVSLIDLADNQNITGCSFDAGTANLTIGIEDGSSQVISLIDLVDDQNITGCSFDAGTANLTIGIEDGSSQVISLIDLVDDQDISGSSFNTATNELTIGIEDGASETIDLSVLDNAGSDDQTLTLAGTNLTIEDGNTVTFTNWDTDNSDDITTSTAAGGDLTGTYPNPTLDNGVVANAEIADATEFVSVQNSAGTPQFGVTDGNRELRFNGSGGIGINFNATTHQVTVDGSGVVSGQWTDAGDYLTPSDGGGIRMYESGANAGKIDAQKIDPVVQIDGKQYATWVVDGIGLRTDVVGQAQLDNGVYKVDLADQPEASDLWLFYHVVAENSIVPFVTPQGRAYLIARLEGSVLYVEALEGDPNAKFSYRLSGKRIDEAAKSSEEINTRRPEDHTNIYLDVEAYDKNGNPIKK